MPWILRRTDFSLVHLIPPVFPLYVTLRDESCSCTAYQMVKKGGLNSGTP